jgi:hypothetical protein
MRVPSKGSGIGSVNLLHLLNFASIPQVEGFGMTSLEMEPDGRGDGAGRHVMGSAEGGKEVV